MGVIQSLNILTALAWQGCLSTPTAMGGYSKGRVLLSWANAPKTRRTRPITLPVHRSIFSPGSKHMGYTGRFLISLSSDTSVNGAGRRPDPA